MREYFLKFWDHPDIDSDGAVWSNHYVDGTCSILRFSSAYKLIAAFEFIRTSLTDSVSLFNVGDSIEYLVLEMSTDQFYVRKYIEYRITEDIPIRTAIALDFDYEDGKDALEGLGFTKEELGL